MAAALRTLDRLLATEDALLLLAVLVRNVRTAWTAVAARRRGRSVDEIARALRLPPGVIATLTSAERPDTHFARQIRRCWETEHRLKSSGEPRAEMAALEIRTPADDALGLLDARWILMTSERELLARPRLHAARWTPDALEETPRLWTDDYSNLLQVLK